MLRKLRVGYPGAIYHVINRGDRREPIFRSSVQTLLDHVGSRLLELLEPSNACCNVPHDSPEFMQVARFQVGLQALEQRSDGGPVPLEEARDVRFVKAVRKGID